MISAAVESYLDRAWIFRFPNVIGPRATHGIIFDLLTKLSKNPPDLEVLGDGSQQKPYLHVSELIDAMLFITEAAQDRLNWFNIGPPDEGATVQQIAETILPDSRASTSHPVHRRQSRVGRRCAALSLLHRETGSTRMETDLHVHASGRTRRRRGSLGSFEARCS